MTDTTSLAQFVAFNDQDCRRFLTSTGVAAYTIDDTIQSFYSTCIDSSVLTKWNPVRGQFSTYVFSVLKNVASHTPACNTSDDDRPAPASGLVQRVIDFRAYLQKHGGDHTDELYSHLWARIKGETITDHDNDYVRQKYKKLLRQYLMLEKFNL